MKITPEELKTFNIYQLKQTMAERNCTPEEDLEICHYILEHDEFFQAYTTCVFDLKEFFKHFTANTVDLNLGQKIYDKFISSEQCIDIFFSNYGRFSEVYKLFMSIELTREIRVMRCCDFLNQLSNSPTFNQMKNVSDHYLPELIELDPTMIEKIVIWAKETQLIQSDEEENKILERVVSNQKSKEEKKRKQELEKALESFRVEISKRHQCLNPTNLHKIVSMGAPNGADFKKAIALIENGAVLEELDQFGATPLINAAIAGNRKMALILISRGAKVSVTYKGYNLNLSEFFYSFHSYSDSDHDYAYLDNRKVEKSATPMSTLLTKIEGLEKSYLTNGVNCYSWELIKADLLSIIQNKQLQNSELLSALCGYIFNKVAKLEQDAVCRFFMDKCDVEIRKESDLLTSDLLASLDNNEVTEKFVFSQDKTPKPLSIDTLVNYREQLFSNKENSSPTLSNVSFRQDNVIV